MRFPKVVSLENLSIVSEVRVFLRGLFELVIGQKKTSIADHSNCKNYPSGDNITEFNHAMKSVRISIEWSYMTAGSLFPYLRTKSKFQLLGSRIFVVCMILKNYHACYYGNLTMNYFNIILPDNFIHYYMNKIVL